MSRTLRRLSALVGLVVASIAAAAPALAREIRTERVHFARGANSATIEGSIKGYQIVGYVLGAPMPAAAGETGTASAVPELSDLIGVRGSAAETQMHARGYVGVGGHTEPHASVTYWRKSSDGSCVSVRTADGRYTAIARASAQDCDRAAAATRAVETPDRGGYRTVCGVFVDGKPVRYVCSVVGGDQRAEPTTLRFPDLVMVLHWLGGNRVRIEMEGSAPLQATWSESEGETDIVSSEKTWFYISNREAAAREVQSMGK
jgi:hypothetical protein